MNLKKIIGFRDWLAQNEQIKLSTQAFVNEDDIPVNQSAKTSKNQEIKKVDFNKSYPDGKAMLHKMTLKMLRDRLSDKLNHVERSRRF